VSIAPGELLGSTDVEARAASSPGSPRARSGLGRRTRGRLVTGIVMMAPFALLLGGLLGWPIVWTFVLSFTNEELTGPTALHRQFIGFSNFNQLFQDGGFGGSVVHTLQYLVGSAYLGQIIFGFMLALLLRRCNRVVQAIVGGIIILSWVVPELIAGFMWYALLGQDGVLQQAANALGLPFSQLLVTHPMLAVNLANCWRGVAFSMLLFTAALAAFPDSLLEAAEVDGAGPVRRIVSVVLPNLKGTILVAVVLVTLATLNDFVLIFTMTGGGPGNESQVLSTYMYQTGITEFRIAYATAVSVVLLIIGVVLSLLYVRALRKAE
jgi:multiple sugar transport system permease protein